jgi:hypothetical protein
MKRYRVKSTPGQSAVLDLLERSPGGYRVRITRSIDGRDDIEESFMSEELFEICIRTDYITEDRPLAAHVA